MSQYFENDSNLKSQKRMLKCYINGQEIAFISDVGVFSNTQIDYGSFIFLKTLLKEDKVDTLLDIGCGYGLLGITLKIFDKSLDVDMIDVNNRALELTKENISFHHLDNINCFYSDGFNNVIKLYQRIITNPPIRAGKKVIYKMFLDAKSHLEIGGSLYVVIKKDLGAQSAFNELVKIYKNVLIINKEKGYWVIKATN